MPAISWSGTSAARATVSGSPRSCSTPTRAITCGPDGGPGLLAQYKAGEDERTTLWAGTYFCAQLVADSYLHMGLLDQSSTPANGYAPGAFASTDPSVLPLRNAALGDIIEFTWSPPPAS